MTTEEGLEHIVGQNQKNEKPPSLLGKILEVPKAMKRRVEENWLTTVALLTETSFFVPYLETQAGEMFEKTENLSVTESLVIKGVLASYFLFGTANYYKNTIKSQRSKTGESKVKKAVTTMGVAGGIDAVLGAAVYTTVQFLHTDTPNVGTAVLGSILAGTIGAINSYPKVFFIEFYDSAAGRKDKDGSIYSKTLGKIPQNWKKGIAIAATTASLLTATYAYSIAPGKKFQNPEEPEKAAVYKQIDYTNV